MTGLLAAAAAVALASPSAAQPKAALAEVRAHLEAVQTMTADFTQTAANGAVLRGKLTIARPGKARFQYESARQLVVADGRSLNFIDYEVDQVTVWPIRGTPLGVVLDPKADLARYARVLPPPSAAIVLVEAKDPGRPEYGIAMIEFRRDEAAPGGLRLAGWTVLDAQGNQTRIDLSNERFNIAIDPGNFRFRDPRRKIVPGKG